MISIRAANKGDLDSFYAISLATGHLGTDASHLYDDPKMVGHIYSAPYLKFATDLSLVAIDELGVAGFIVGAADTIAFEHLLEEEWWPKLRATYKEPDNNLSANWSADQRRSFMIHHPEKTPSALVKTHPAHIHMNLLPRIQGQGIGSSLLKQWFCLARELNVTHVHLGANLQNKRAVRFWKQQEFNDYIGMTDLLSSRTKWLTCSI